MRPVVKRANDVDLAARARPARRRSPGASDGILDRAPLPRGELLLVRAGKHVVIRVGDRPLMSSDVHDSEDAFGRIVATSIAGIAKPRVLIGGLGLGFTTRAALDLLPSSSRVTVAELVPEVVRWNRGAQGRYAGRVLDDPRVRVVVDDVAAAIGRAKATYDSISLDVDNGPRALTHPDNERLYRRAGLIRIRRALRPGGVLAVWSSFPSRAFTTALAVVGTVELVRTPPASPGGPSYYIWLARKRT
jgi:spermidine synthase